MQPRTPIETRWEMRRGFVGLVANILQSANGHRVGATSEYPLARRARIISEVWLGAWVIGNESV